MDRLQQYDLGQQTAYLTLAANTALAVVKLLAGLLAASSAMLADSLHTITDLATTGAVLVSLKIARRPPDSEHPYGHGKAELICANTIALLLISMGGVMAWKSVSSLTKGNLTVPGRMALAAALLSIVVQELLYQLSYRTGKKINSKALQADAWHHRSDALSSVAALIGIALARFGYTWCDPLAGLLVSLAVVTAGTKLWWKAIDELMDRQCDPDYNHKMTGVALNVDGVKGVQNLTVRYYGPSKVIDVTVLVDAAISVRLGHSIAVQVEQAFMQSDQSVQSVFVHIEPLTQRHGKTVSQAG